MSWDSHCFGYKVGEIIASAADLEQSLEQAYQENYKLLYLKTQPENQIINDLAQKLQGILVDEKITFSQATPENVPDSKATLYQADTMHPQLLNLALQSGEYSRFRVDKNFKNKEYEKLYTAWIENSIRKEIAQEVIIYKKEIEIVGLLTLSICQPKARVGLLSVDRQHQQQGIGKNLIYKAFEIAKKAQATDLEIVMQKANTKACLFYERVGFEIEKIENIYHFWLK